MNLFDQYVSLITEAKFKDHAIAYHGTSDVFLRSIMKNGLMPTDEKSKRVWGSSSNKNIDYLNRSLESIIGSIYLSYNLITAVSGMRKAIYEFGGNGLIIVTKIMPESSYLDEDYIYIPSIHDIFGSEYVAMFYAIYSYFGLKSDDSSFDPVKRVKNFYDQTGMKPDLLSSELIKQIIDVVLKRFFYYQKPLIDTHLLDNVYCAINPGECFSIYDKPSKEEEKLLSERKKEFREKYKSIIYDWYSKGFDPEKKQKDLMERLTIVFKNRSRSLSETGMGSIRFTSPIKFSGSNKIIAIYTIKDDNTDEIIEIYNKSNFNFLEEYRSKIDNKAYIVEKPYES